MKRKFQRPERHTDLAGYIDALCLIEEPDYTFKQAISKYEVLLTTRLNKLMAQQLKASKSRRAVRDGHHYNKKIELTKNRLSLLAHQYPEYLI